MNVYSKCFLLRQHYVQQFVDRHVTYVTYQAVRGTTVIKVVSAPQRSETTRGKNPNGTFEEMDPAEIRFV